MTNASDGLGPSLPRDLFNEGGEVFDAELEALLEIFEQLDNDDRKIYRDKNSEFIASHPAPRILIVAGPGSGKSFLFLQRIQCWLQLDGKATIYVSSFVRKLVKDLQGDVTQKLDEADAKRVTVSTLHGLARSILERSHGSSEHRRGLHTNIVSEEWMKVVWTDVQAFHPGLASSYTNAKFIRMFNTEEFDSSGQWPDLFTTYEVLSSFYNSVGFADMIVLARKAIDEKPSLILHSYWIIDEFQDFNTAEDHLIRALTSSANGVLIAGDDEQALYQSLKQSLPEIIISYYEGDEYANAMLPFCSRCSYWVCLAASAFITAGRPEGSIKKIYLPLVVDPSAPKVQLIATPTPISEVDYIQRFVADHQNELDAHIARMEAGEETDPFLLILTPDKKLKLLKTGGADQVLREWLTQWSVISTGHSGDYKRILAYCSATGVQADNYVLRRVLHYEGLTSAQVHPLLEKALEEKITLAQVDEELIANALAKCAAVSSLIDRDDLETSDIVREIGELISISSPELLVAELDATPITGGIFAVEDEAEEEIETAGSSAAIEMLTLVGSKGLSAQHVIIIGCDDVNLNYTSRLAFFVALTRARSSLLQTVQGYSPLGAGLRILPWTGMPMLLAPVVGILAQRWGGKPLVLVGLVLQAIGLFWLALILTPTTAYTQMVPAFIVAGLGMTMFFVPIASLVLGSVNKDLEGVASGTNAAFRELGGVFGIAILGAVFSSSGGYLSAQDYVNGLRPAIFVGAGVVVLGFFAALLVPRRRPLAIQERNSLQRIREIPLLDSPRQLSA